MVNVGFVIQFQTQQIEATAQGFKKKILLGTFNTLTRIFKVLCEHKLQEEVVSDRGQRLPPAGDGAPICQPDMLSWEFCGFATSGMFLLNGN